MLEGKMSLFSPDDPGDVTSFAWGVDSKGYKLVDGKVRRNGGDIRAFNPAAIPGLHRRFTLLHRREGESDDSAAIARVVVFVDKYGLLGFARSGHEVQEESLSSIMRESNRMAFLLHLLVDTRELLSPEHVATFDRDSDVRFRWRMEMQEQPDGRVGLTLRMVPLSLLDYCWSLAGLEVLGGQMWKNCLICHEPFRVGEGGARRDRETCSQSHKVLLTRRRKATPLATQTR
jgi:hypothetical protein